MGTVFEVMARAPNLLLLLLGRFLRETRRQAWEETCPSYWVSERAGKRLITGDLHPVAREQE